MISAPGDLNVVVVDDDPDDFELIRALLAEGGFARYRLRWVSKASEALEEIRKQDADVYLIDYHLGERTGLELLKEIGAEDYRRPMILLTGQGDREVDIAAMESGASDFLAKGQLSGELLERSIRYCLRRAADRDKIRAADRARYERDAAQAADKAKTEFLSYMSHEIRSPLNAIIGFAGVAQSAETSDRERHDCLKIIQRSGDHLLRVINDTLDISKIEGGRLETRRRPFDWREAIRDVVAALRSGAAERGIECALDLEDGAPRLICSDDHRFRQILFNALGNAIKFSSSGDRVEIRARFRAELQRIEIEIQDEGIGIAPSDQGKLFKPFAQANVDSSRAYGGTGLGLCLSRKLAEALGGAFDLVRSVPEEGSTFRLTMPAEGAADLAPGRDEAAPAHRAPAAPPQIGAEKELRVLLVDDSVDNQKLVGCFLKSKNVRLSCANNGEEGVRAALKGEFDAVLMDIQMPQVDGYEATERLRRGGFQKPIIALTAHAFEEERERAMRAGFSDFVRKPIDRAQLIRSLFA